MNYFFDLNGFNVRLTLIFLYQTRFYSQGKSNITSETRGGGLHGIFRAQVCAARMGGFSGPNSLNKGPFFGRFAINMGGLPRNWQK